jgi:hypothetical protein
MRCLEPVLKIWILVPGQGGADFQTAGNRLVVANFKAASNPAMEPKDFLEMGSSR